MSGQIIFFEKNKADYSFSGVVATASESPDTAPYALNRSNLSGWITSGSVDANNTTFEVDFGDYKSVTELLLVKHNFKNFTVKWDNEGVWTDFSPAINVTNCTDLVSWFEVASQLTKKIQVTITGTQTANADKFLYQFIATEKIGQLEGWPVIAAPAHSRNLTVVKTLSGKSYVGENLGAFSYTLNVTEWKSGPDLTVVERLYSRSEGFLSWLCGGNENQFSSKRQGYRLEDIHLMKCVNDYAPEWVKGQYLRGLKISMKLSEVIA